MLNFMDDIRFILLEIDGSFSGCHKGKTGTPKGKYDTQFIEYDIHRATTLNMGIVIFLIKELE